MKFYPPFFIRFFYRYAFTIVFAVFPTALAVYLLFQINNAGDGIPILIVTLLMLAICGTTIIHLWFWEKFFSVLIVTENEIRLVCPFRRSRVIEVRNCLEIGAYLECVEKGIPSEWIYISEHHYPQKSMDKNGAIKVSDHFIKFWYSRELACYLIRHYPSTMTGVLNAYIRKKQL